MTALELIAEAEQQGPDAQGYWELPRRDSRPALLARLRAEAPRAQARIAGIAPNARQNLD